METDQIPNIAVVVDLIAIVVAAFFLEVLHGQRWPISSYSRLWCHDWLQVKKNEERHRSLNELILLKIEIRERKKIRKKERKKEKNKQKAHFFNVAILLSKRGMKMF